MNQLLSPEQQVSPWRLLLPGRGSSGPAVRFVVTADCGRLTVWWLRQAPLVPRSPFGPGTHASPHAGCGGCRPLLVPTVPFSIGSPLADEAPLPSAYTWH